ATVERGGRPLPPIPPFRVAGIGVFLCNRRVGSGYVLGLPLLRGIQPSWMIGRRHNGQPKARRFSADGIKMSRRFAVLAYGGLPRDDPCEDEGKQTEAVSSRRVLENRG